MFFLNKYFALGNWNDELEQNKGWIWRALQSPSQYPSSNAACQALVTAFFANATQTTDLHPEALRSHRNALNALHEAMQLEITFDVLCTVVLLGLYEACLLTMHGAWQKHAKALRHLCMIKGPDFFRERPARSLLMLIRHQLVVDAILSREKCFLEEPEWSGILASDDRDSEVALKLGDLVIHSPGILHDIVVLERKEDTDYGEIRRLDQRLDRQLSGMRQWWPSWASDSGRVPVRLRSQEVDGQMAPPPPVNVSQGKTILQFRNLVAASGYCLYHTHVILVMQWRRRLSKLNPALENLVVDDEHLIPHALAICEALHFYSLPQYRHIGAMYMNLPARVAWQALPAASSHRQWIEDLMEFMAERSGFNFPRTTLRHLEVNE
jgi:hypothetical protein